MTGTKINVECDSLYPFFSLPQTRILHVCTESRQEALSPAVLHGKGSMCVCVCVCAREGEERILGLNEVLQKCNRPLILFIIKLWSAIRLHVSRTQSMRKEDPFNFGSSPFTYTQPWLLGLHPK